MKHFWETCEWVENEQLVQLKVWIKFQASSMFNCIWTHKMICSSFELLHCSTLEFLNCPWFACYFSSVDLDYLVMVQHQIKIQKEWLVKTCVCDFNEGMAQVMLRFDKMFTMFLFILWFFLSFSFKYFICCLNVFSCDYASSF